MHTISKQRRSSDEEESARLSLRSQAPEWDVFIHDQENAIALSITVSLSLSLWREKEEEEEEEGEKMRNVTTVGFVSPENLLNVLQQDSRLLLVLTLDSTTFWNMFSKSAGIKCLVFENPAEN